MEIEAVFQFIRQKRLAVVSTVHANGTPEAALVGIAIATNNDIVFDTLSTTRKVCNLAARPAAARAARKQFFFEKKNQKTFTQLDDAPDTNGAYPERVRFKSNRLSWRTRSSSLFDKQFFSLCYAPRYEIALREQKFFGSFFQKRTASFALAFLGQRVALYAGWYKSLEAARTNASRASWSWGYSVGVVLINLRLAPWLSITASVPKPEPNPPAYA